MEGKIHKVPRRYILATVLVVVVQTPLGRFP